jgi:hypothetical protein
MNGKIIKVRRCGTKVIDVKKKGLVSHQNPKRGGKNKNG